ncbi:hypothetical protein GMRT_21426 [Giardia muris]|uniref:Uncharacterized protein n=1 Tax=Giardia muris TaxID=5742 RepID=A0A4Z1SY19_GIAMU|nr:hypothetical protein GMRT_21426 [Giardia muris]|eukprot:TNJ30586.1 hypothetical protein GMRT_21426 [Giardia muris]
MQPVALNPYFHIQGFKVIPSQEGGRASQANPSHQRCMETQYRLQHPVYDIQSNEVVKYSLTPDKRLRPYAYATSQDATLDMTNRKVCTANLGLLPVYSGARVISVGPE